MKKKKKASDVETFHFSSFSSWSRLNFGFRYPRREDIQAFGISWILNLHPETKRNKKNEHSLSPWIKHFLYIYIWDLTVVVGKSSFFFFLFSSKLISYFLLRNKLDTKEFKCRNKKWRNFFFLSFFFALSSRFWIRTRGKKKERLLISK